VRVPMIQITAKEAIKAFSNGWNHGEPLQWLPLHVFSSFQQLQVLAFAT